MNFQEFESKLKERICLADWHHRYYVQMCRRFNRVDFWLKGSLGLIATAGAVMATMDDLRIFGAILSATCSLILGAVLPNFKWDSILRGWKEELSEWTTILQGYQGIHDMSKIQNRDEMLLLEFQKVEELRKTSQRNERGLPDDKKLLDKLEVEVRNYYELD